MRWKPIIKTKQQIQQITEAGKWHTELLHLLRDAAKPWVILLELEAQAKNFLTMHNLTGAFKWYQWFPANCCLSVNDCVVHGIPDDTVLHEWDILKIDVGVVYKEWISDAAISVVVWGDSTNPEATKLKNVTKDALDAWLTKLVPWENFYAYWKTVAKFVEKNNCSVIKNLTWHGVWVKVHEAPSLYNWPHKSLKKVTIQPGMVIALEPITAITSESFVQWTKNERNIYTEHSDLWAQWEYTLLITDNGYEILAWIE